MNCEEALDEIRGMCHRIENEWGLCRTEVDDEEADEIIAALQDRHRGKTAEWWAQASDTQTASLESARARLSDQQDRLDLVRKLAEPNAESGVPWAVMVMGILGVDAPAAEDERDVCA